MRRSASRLTRSSTGDEEQRSASWSSTSSLDRRASALTAPLWQIRYSHGPQIAHGHALAQRGPRAHERRLQHVLGAVAGHQAVQVAQQRAPVAIHDRLERTVVARRGERDKALVRLRAQQGR